MEQLQELVQFLGSDNVVIKTVALQNLLGYSTSHKDVFRPAGLKPITDLVAVSQEKGATNQKIALSILVNVSDTAEVRKHIITNDDEYLQYLVNRIKQDDPNAALMSMLLANLSFETNFRLQKQQAADLLSKYVENKPEHDYLSYVFVNYTNRLEGRTFFLTDDNLLSIIVFNDSKSEKRKEGSGKILKNILFNVQSHAQLVADENLKLLTYILSPLMSSSYNLDDEEEFALPEDLQFLDDKERESNSDLLAVYLECLLLLCTTRPIRETLREKSVYPIIRELHKSVEDERLCDLSEQLVQLLMRDEAPEGEDKIAEVSGDDEEDEDDQMIEVL